MRIIQINNFDNKKSSPNFKATLNNTALTSLNKFVKKLPSDQREGFYKAMEAAGEGIRALKIGDIEPAISIKEIDADIYAVDAYVPEHPKVRGEGIKINLDGKSSGENGANLLVAKFGEAVEALKNADSYINYMLQETTYKINQGS